MKTVLFVLFPIFISFQVLADLPQILNPKDKISETDSTADENSFLSDEKPVTPVEGPHQGHLVAAANYNLEIIWEDDTAKIYLLDSEFKNPVVQNSEIGVFIQSGNTESEMNCLIVEDYFQCKQTGKKFKKGQLAISSKRNGVQAEEVKVNLPFNKKNEVKSAEKSSKTKDVKKKK